MRQRSIRLTMMVILFSLFIWLPAQIDAARVAEMPETTMSQQGHLTPSDQPIVIALQQAVFDPLQGPPPIPPSLTSSPTRSAAATYYLVQFTGPIQTRWRTEVETMGGRIIDYIPQFAYIVKMDEATAAQVSRLEAVRWVGLYQPAFRVSNDLLNLMERAAPDAAATLILRGFPGEPVAELTPQFASLGVTLLESWPDSGGGAIFKVEVAAAAIPYLAHIPALAWIELYIEPQLTNAIARSNTIMGKDQIETALGLYGANQIVAVGDTGLSTGNTATVHQDFAGRVFGGTWGPGSCGTWADNHSHGTHVAGSVLGSGFRSGANIPSQIYSGSNAGIAPEALLYVWSFCNNFSGLPAAPYASYYGVLYGIDSRLRINTNSWGYTTGQGQYNTFTRETDRFIWDNQDMVLTYAAGNEGTDGNSDGVVDLGSINMPSTAKNVITVGASENYRLTGGYNPGGACSTWGGCWPADYPANPINSDRLSNNVNGMVAFSSRGPTLSGRLKPDLVAPGSNIVSTRNESTGTGWGVYDAYYLYMGGTSMATPLVAGASAIVREYYTTTHTIDPTAALVKATLINGAYDMTPGQYGAGATQDVIRRPDNNQGWGRVDLPNTLIYSGNRQLWFHEHSGLSTGGSYEVNFNILNGSPMRVTLVWADYPGTEASHGALVNDLDLEIYGPDGTLYRGNTVLTGGPADRTNNVEGVDLLPAVGGTFTVRVAGYNIPQGPQPFALVVTADMYHNPVGYLTGLVDDGVNPIAGAMVTTAGPIVIGDGTNSSGVYTMTLPVGNYDVTASAYGYSPATVNNIAIISGTTTVQNFTLSALPSYTVSGVVTDANTGWPLYARLDIPGYPGSPIWTDPVSGAYSVTLLGGITHDFSVSAWVAGYNSANRTVGPLSGNVTENFALTVNQLACTAPGYSPSTTTLFSHSFEGTGTTFPSDNWQRVDTSGTAGEWTRPTGGSNPTASPRTGTRLALFNSFIAAAGNSTRLYRTVDLNLASASSPVLSFWMYHDTGYSGANDRIQIQISTNAGAAWTNVGSPVSRYNGSTGWQEHVVPLTAYAGNANVRLGFNAISAFGNNMFIDDVTVINQICTAPTGGLVIGNVYEGFTPTGLNGATVSNEDGYSTTSAATPLDPNVADGFYTLYSPAGPKLFTASLTGYLSDTAIPTVIAGSTIRQDFNLVPPPPPSSHIVCTLPNVAIPDNNVAGVNSTLTFTRTGEIADVNLYLRGPHTWVGDLVFTLRHPNGTTTVTAVDRPGVPASTFGCGNDNFNLWLDDAGTDGPVENQCAAAPPALFGRATPNNALSGFNNLPSNGVWTLNASDRAAGDTGTLQEWCVEITIAAPVWRGTQNSNWNNGQNWSSGIVPAATANVVLSPAYLNGANAWPILEMDPTVHHLTLEPGAELTIPPGRTITVNGTLTNRGLLRQTINNVNSSTSFLHITGAGGDAYRGVEIINPAGGMGTTTVEIRGDQDCTSNPTSQPVQRCFDIAPTTNQSATVRFYYLPTEANGNPEDGVSVYHWNGATWDLQGGTYTRSSGGNPRWVQVTGVADYSPFVLDNATPTAVTLRSMGVTTPAVMLLLVLMVLAAAAATIHQIIHLKGK